MIGQVADYNRAGADGYIGANSDSRNAESAGPEQDAFTDGNVTSEARPGADVGMRADVAVVIDAAAGVQDAILADLSVGVHDDAAEDDRAGADFCGR